MSRSWSWRLGETPGGLGVVFRCGGSWERQAGVSGGSVRSGWEASGGKLNGATPGGASVVTFWPVGSGWGSKVNLTFGPPPVGDILKVVLHLQLPAFDDSTPNSASNSIWAILAKVCFSRRDGNSGLEKMNGVWQ